MRTNIKLSILAMAGLMMSLSCTELSNEGVSSEGAVINKQLSVSSGEWPLEQVRSSFIPGQGISLSGDEHLAVYYNAYDAQAENQFATGMQKLCVEASPSPDGTYAFSHDEIAEVEKYNYFFIMPYRQLQNTGTHNGILKAFYNMRAVQYPSATSYDPAFDYLVGKPSENVDKSETVEVTAFKRIVAPFKLTITDPSGLLAGEAVHAVTIDFPGGEKVAGKFYVDFYSGYAEAGIAAKNNSYSGTALTAVYPDGLEPSAGAYEVWLVSLPASFEAGQTVTVTVTGETKTVSCSAALPSATQLVADRFNSLSFGLSEIKTDYESSQTLHFDFSGLTSVNSMVFAASDGEEYTFVNDGCRHYGLSKAMITSGIKIKTANTLTFPQISGKAIKKVRVYTHEESSDKSTSQATLALTCGEAAASALYYPRSEGGFPQGYVDLCFEQAQSGTVKLNVSYSDQGTSDAIFTSLAIYLEDNGQAGEEPSSQNDYWAAYQAGETLQFGDLSISSETHPDAKYIEASALTYDMMSDGGVYFVGSSPDYVTISGGSSTPSVANNSELILIGRYADAQPRIIAKELRANVKDFAMINVDFKTTSTNQMICKSSSATTSSALRFIDCRIGSDSAWKYLVRDYQGGAAPYAKILFDNCVIDVTNMTTSVYYVNSSAVSEAQSLSFADCVIYSTSTLTSQYLMSATSLATLDVIFRGNTVANIYPGSGLIRVPSLKSLVVEDNVFYAAGQTTASSSPAITRLDSAPNGNFEVSGNVMSAVDCNRAWRTYRSGNEEPKVAEDNTSLTTSPFAEGWEASTGYFPVDGTAGASYTTKPYFKN